jgi:hypothetical protein
MFLFAEHKMLLAYNFSSTLNKISTSGGLENVDRVVERWWKNDVTSYKLIPDDYMAEYSGGCSTLEEIECPLYYLAHIPKSVRLEHKIKAYCKQCLMMSTKSNVI